MRNQVSKLEVREILHKYLDEKLANRIFWEIVDADEYDRKHMIGMTCGEWLERFDDDFRTVWADDTNAGFGKAGDSVYGNINDCIICRTSWDGHEYTLFVWCEPLHSEKSFVNAAVAEYHKRHS